MKKKLKTLLLVLIDIIFILVAYYISWFIRFDGRIVINFEDLISYPIIYMILIKIIVYLFFGLYNSLWKYAGTNELMQVVVAAVVGNAIFISYNFLIQSTIPRSIFVLMV